MGAAYTGKVSFQRLLFRSSKKLQEAVDDIQTELNSYKLQMLGVAE